MALVTLQRSPSPSNDPNEDSAEGGDDGLDGRAALRHKSLSESYFTVKGAALILPHSEINRKTSRKNHGGEIQRHLQSMLYLLRPADKIKVAIRLENQRESEHRYMALVSTNGRQDTEECVILGLDCTAQPQPSHTPAQPPPSHTAAQPPPSHTAAQPQPSHTAAQPQPSHTAAQSQPSHTAAQPQPSHTAAQSQPSHTAAQPQPSHTAAQSQPSHTAAQSQTSHTAAQPQPSHTATATAPSPAVLPESHIPGASASDELEGRGVASASIGLVLPVWMGMKVRLSGDGGFSIITADHSYLFKPVSVQAMWSAIQSVDKALYNANQMKYLQEGLTHTWVEYYRCKVDTSNQVRLATWNLMEDVEIFAPASLKLTNENETEKLKLLISAKLKEVMMSVDLDDATSRSLRQLVEEALNRKLDEFRNYFDEEMMRILGQMDAPSQITDFLYLGSEWNASNLDELQKLGIKYILNVTREIDNFFTGMFHYWNVRIYDYEDSELMKHWLKTHKFINKARKHGAKVLVHCKMGVSRSASTVIAYLMKENRWSLETALAFVKEKRSCVRPNKGFMEQLHTYEGILNASNKREIFRSKSEHDIVGSTESGEGTEPDSSQQESFLGESLFPMMSSCEWSPHTLTTEEILLGKNFPSDHSYTGIEPDFETDSRSADSMEESLPDMPSPLNKDAPVQGVPFTTQDPQTYAGPQATAFSSSPPRTGDLGLTSRIIKPDTSWIKLEMPGESSTDCGSQEGMEVAETDTEVAETDTEAARGKPPDERADYPAAKSQPFGSPVTPPVIFVMGFEWDGEVPRTKDGALAGESSPPSRASGCGDQAGRSVSDMGVHQYYSRERIPWHPGKVRDIREELCRSGGQSSASPPTAPADLSKSGRTSADESEKTLLEAVGRVREAHPVPQCESCVELSDLDRETAGAYGMEVEDVSRSVYDLEEIPLTPGTVQRTRREIEQRQKLFGEDCDQSIYGMQSIRRSSSLREKRESSRTRHSERRRTCTPIISPSAEKDTEPGDVEMRSPVLNLSFEADESTMDDAPMAVDGRECGDSQSDRAMVAYTVGAACVPVKAGTVRRHKREMEIKSSDGSQQRTQSTGSMGSACSVEELETCQWPLSLPTAASSSKPLSDLARDGLVHATYIPPSKPQTSPSKGADGVDARAGQDGEASAALTAVGRAAKDSGGKSEGDHGVPGLHGKRRGWIAGADTPPAPGSRGEGLKPVPGRSPFPCRLSNLMEGVPQEDCTADSLRTDPSVFRSYSHSFPSTKKPYGRSNIDPETLAMIREIGSAFVTCPSLHGEEEDNGGNSTSLVKHLAKKIERETRSRRPERKIVLVDSSAKQMRTEVRGHSRVESSQSSLFIPSPEFTLNMAKHLGGSEHFISPPAQSGTAQGQTTENVSKSAPFAPPRDLSGVAATHLIPSQRAQGADRSSSEPPSVVKHLCGRFESHAPFLYSDGEPNPLISCGAQSGHVPSSVFAPETCVVPPAVRDRGDSRYSALLAEGLLKSRSLDEPAGSELRVSLTGAVHSAPQPQNTRRPRSAETVPFAVSPGQRHSPSVPVVRSPWDREPGQGMEEQREALEGAKMRRFHGKSHPLSRLQYQGQGEGVYPPTVHHHSPFHSSM